MAGVRSPRPRPPTPLGAGRVESRFRAGGLLPSPAALCRCDLSRGGGGRRRGDEGAVPGHWRRGQRSAEHHAHPPSSASLSPGQGPRPGPETTAQARGAGALGSQPLDPESKTAPR